MPDSTVRRWLEELVELDYLEADRRGQGKITRYRLTGRGPKEELVLGLLSPEDLRREAKRTGNFATSSNFVTGGGEV